MTLRSARARGLVAVTAIAVPAVLAATLAMVATAPSAVAAPGALALERRLTAAEPEIFGHFGAQVGLDGDLMAVLERDVVHLHRRGTGAWGLERSITLSDHRGVSSLDLDGNTLVLGLPHNGFDPVSEKIFGQAWVYDLAAPASPPVVLTVAPTSSFGGFGQSVAVDGNRLIVGADGDRRAYVYHRSGSTWALAPGGTLVPSPPATAGWFARSADIGGDFAVVPDAFNAFVYRWTGTTWAFDAKVASPNGEQIDIESGAQVNGGTLLIANNPPLSVGARKVWFLQRTSTWGVAQDVTVPTAIDEAALDGTNLAILDDDGTIYQYAKEGATWVAGPPLTLPDAADGWDNSPDAVLDMSGNRVAVGAPAERGGDLFAAGVAYVLARNGSSAQPPGAPTAVSAAPGPGLGTATVQWQPPASDGGGALVKYLIKANPQNSSSHGLQVSVPAPATSATVSGLTEFGVYTFTVVAENVVAEGPPSAPSNVVNLPGPPGVASPYTQPDAIGDTSDPAGDIAETAIDYVDGQITVSMRTVAPEDPNTSPWWRTPGEGNWFYVSFAAPAENHLMIFQHQSTNASPFSLPGHDVIARFEFDDSCGRPVFPGEFVDGWFRTTFPASCIGSPSAVRFSMSVPPANDSSDLSPPVLPRSTAVPGSSEFVPVSPVRLLDTRAGGTPGAGEVVELPVVGRAGVPGDAQAAVLNLTGTEAVGDGFVTAWPCGEPRPLASNLNLRGGATTPNLAIVRLGAGGKVCLFTQSGAHLVADLAGWFPAGSSFTGVTPERLLDTRPGATPGAGEVVELPVAGRAGVPGDAQAAVLNLTGTEAVGDGFVTAWPCGEPRPLASNLNLRAGVTTPNLAIVRLGAGGKVCLFTQSGAHLIADLAGWFPAGSSFTGVTPERLLDTRPGATPGAGEIVELPVAGRAGVPGDAQAAVLNLTGTEAAGDGFVTAWPCGEPRPLASNLNLRGGATTPNLAIVRLGAGG